MPIKIQSDLPVKEILEKENIFVMDETKGFLAGPHPRVPFGRTGEKMSRTVIVHGLSLIHIYEPFT